MKKFEVTFEPGGRKVGVPAGTTLLEAARENGILVSAPCGGRGLCGGCAVRITGEAEPETTADDRRHLTDEQLAAGVRLACTHIVERDITVHLAGDDEPPAAKLELMAVESARAALDGVPRKTALRLEEPDLQNLAVPLDQALLAALPPGSVSRLALPVVREFARLVRRGERELTLLVHDDTLAGVEPGDTSEALYGAAVDIGTTTIALYLCDLRTGRVVSGSAATNSQTAWGSDVMSRIGLCIEKQDGLSLMARLVREDIAGLLESACGKASVRPGNVYRWVLVGNTTMQHLFFGLDPYSLGHSPYLPTVNGAVDFDPGELGLPGSPWAEGVFLPTVAGHVGADTVAVALAADLDQRGGLSLAVDLGTNGEIVLADRGRLICTSTAAGPAFEGMRILNGMRAETGAIDRFWVDRDGEPGFSVIGNTAPAGICGSGLMDMASALLEAGVIDSTGWILPPGKAGSPRARKLSQRLEEGGRGQWLYVVDEYSDGNCAPRRVLLTQKDIRELQLAAGAISSGIGILLEVAGRRAEEIDEVLLTGAFGNYLNPASAVRIGMLRGVEIEKIHTIGNGAGLGARQALFSAARLDKAVRLAARMEFVELGAHPRWDEKFTESMIFPETKST